MIRKIGSLVLDVDGTLWDSTELVAQAWNKTIRANGLLDFTTTAKQLQGLFGRTMAAIAEALFPEMEKEAREHLLHLCEVEENDYLMADPCHICYPGVIDSIKKISEKIPVCIVSNCQQGYIEVLLHKTGLGPYVTDFDCYGNNQLEKWANIRQVIERNHLQDAVYVGDTQGDCDSARLAGVPFIYAGYGFGTVKEKDEEISSFPELLSLIERG